jgi:hypothetical protein
VVKTVAAVRYITPLRQGSSLPAIVEADDGRQYVMKFVGAGQGRKALIAELLAGEIARKLKLRVPELVLITLDPELGPSEPDPEIFDLLRFSVGLNLGMAYLPQAFEYSELMEPRMPEAAASDIVWFDAYVTNVDRTPRNTNMLVWQKQVWLIDHGACLYFHHDWGGYLDKIESPFAHIKNHALLPLASGLGQADERSKRLLNTTVIEDLVQLVPNAWLAGGDAPFGSPDEYRRAYATYLRRRLEASSVFVQEAQNARAHGV